MAQSRPLVKTTDLSTVRGRDWTSFSTHKPTARAARVACPGNLAALKPPLASWALAWLAMSHL